MKVIRKIGQRMKNVNNLKKLVFYFIMLAK